MKNAAAIFLALSPLCVSFSSCRASSPSSDSEPARPHVRDEIVTDMNGNGVDDMIDISDGTSLDEDLNGIPDEVEAMLSTDK